MGKLVTLGVVVALGQLLVCAALLVVRLLVGPSDWIGYPSYFLQYSVGLLSFLIPAVVWLSIRPGGINDQARAAYAEQLAEADRVGGRPGAVS